MTTCGRCGRCFRRRRGSFSGRFIGPGSCASSISGSRQRAVPVGHWRRAAAGSSWRVWAIRARAPARWSSRSRRPICFGASALFVVAGRVAADAGLGSPGRHPRPRRSPDGGVRRVLRPAEGRLALLRAGRSAGQGLCRAPAGLPRARRSTTSSTRATRRRAWSSPSDHRPATETAPASPPCRTSWHRLCELVRQGTSRSRLSSMFAYETSKQAQDSPDRSSRRIDA